MLNCKCLCGLSTASIHCQITLHVTIFPCMHIVTQWGAVQLGVLVFVLYYIIYINIYTVYSAI